MNCIVLSCLVMLSLVVGVRFTVSYKSKSLPVKIPKAGVSFACYSEHVGCCVETDTMRVSGAHLRELEMTFCGN